MGLAADYDLTGQLARIVTAAERDGEETGDRVSMLTLNQGPPRAGSGERGRRVVVRGHQEIEAFRRWARAQRLLSDGDGGMQAAFAEPEPEAPDPDWERE